MGKFFRPQGPARPSSAERRINPRTTDVDELFHRDFYLGRNPRSPTFQRTVTEERVKHLSETIEEYRSDETNKADLGSFPVPYLGRLHIGRLGQSYYVLDGQHRVQALLRWYEAHKVDFPVHLVIRECNDLDQMKEYFRSINNHLPQEDIMAFESTMDACEAVKMHLLATYPKHISGALNPMHPNINTESLATYLVNLLRTRQGVASYEMPDCGGIIELLEEENRRVGLVMKRGDLAAYDKATTAPKQGFYLTGAVRSANAPAGVAVRAATGPRKKRPSLPKKQREALWSQHHGDSTKGHCEACKNPITAHNFEAGHRVAVAMGGSSHNDNLACLCMQCNREMQTRSLDDWKLSLRGKR